MTENPKVEQTDTTVTEEQVTDKTKKRIAITAASVAGVLVLAGVGLGLYRNHQVQALTAECETAVSAVKKSQQKLTDLIASDDVVKALKITGKQVADKNTVATLKSAVEDADTKINVPDCTVKFFDLNTNPSKDVAVITKTVSNKTSAVSDAVDAVNKSVAAKQLQDAKGKLKKTIESASKVLADSDGKVQDNAVRDSLKKAIDSAKKVLDDKKNTDLKKLDTKTLDDAVNAVNASMEAKRQADEQAAQAAAAQAAAAQRQTYTPQNNYSGGGYSNNAAPAPGNNGGGSIFDRLPHTVTGGDHNHYNEGVCNPYSTCFGNECMPCP